MTVMMKGSALGNLAIAHKAALTGFLCLALIHVLGVSLGMALTHSGTTTSAIREHYQGNENQPDVPVEAIKAPKSAVEILTITHFHLAVMPVFTFLICHILAMSTVLSMRAKVTVIVLSYLAVALEVAVPWMALYAPALVTLRHLSRLGMLVMTLTGVFIPLYEMWWRRD